MNQELDQKPLDKYLWGAATVLRGAIDAGDYKQYISPLLFFKRISDVYDDDFENALIEDCSETVRNESVALLLCVYLHSMKTSEASNDHVLHFEQDLLAVVDTDFNGYIAY
jgi:type I restriction-modification system DNA methylase subunit